MYMITTYEYSVGCNYFFLKLLRLDIVLNFFFNKIYIISKFESFAIDRFKSWDRMP